MIGVLARLQAMTLKGRVVRSIRLLRQPKYLIGAVVGFGWIGFSVIRPILGSLAGFEALPWAGFDDAFATTMHRIAALLVTAILPLPWLLPWRRLGLPFREAELTMLLQAPLTRRQVIQYGLLKSEVGVVASALLLSLVLAGGRPLVWLPSFLGTWILLEFWNVNGKWRALFNLRQTELRFAPARRRRLLLTAGLLGFYAALLFALVPFLARFDATSFAARGAWPAATVANWPPLLVALSIPGWWLTAPMFAAGATKFVAAAVPTLLMIFAQREIVLRSKARFEESALEHAKAQAARRSPARRLASLSSRARTRHPFALDPPGRPEIAVVWKNAVSVSRVPWARIAWFAPALLGVIAVTPAILHLHDLTYGVLAAIGAFLMFFLPLVGGMAWNNDLRAELTQLDLARTWPVSARRLVLAHVASPALFSFAGSVFGAGLVLASLAGIRLRQALTGEPTELHLLPQADGIGGVGSGLAAVLAFASWLPMAAVASFLSSALQNLAILFVPAWMAHSADRMRGVAAFGQRLVFSFGTGLVFMLALIPSAMLVAAAIAAQAKLGIPWSAWEFPFWSALAAIPLLLAGWGMVEAAAVLWRRLDPSQEILDIGR